MLKLLARDGSERTPLAAGAGQRSPIVDAVLRVCVPPVEEQAQRVAALCGVVGQISSMIIWVAWGFFENDYSVARQDVSDFGALDASHPLPYNVILSITGALAVVLAFGLYRKLRPGIGALLGSIGIGVFGVGEFLDGFLREDCSPSGNAACRAAADAGDLSWHHTAHDIESVLTILALIVASFFLGFIFRRRRYWEDLSIWSFVAAAWIAAFVAAYAVLYAFHDGSAVSGLLERAVALSALWLAAVSWRLFVLADPIHVD